jgi:hypothetical protein
MEVVVIHYALFFCLRTFFIFGIMILSKVILYGKEIGKK